MVEKTTFIYALICPISKKIRYIGKSVNPKRRYKEHLKDNGETSYKKKWITKLKNKGLIPYFKIIAQAENDIIGREKEHEFIEQNIETVYNIFMPQKKAPTVADYRILNNNTFDCEFKLQKFNTDKYNKTI